MVPSIKVAVSDDFLRCFAAIPPAKQKSVVKFVTRFRENPTSGGINYEKIRDAADDNLRSVRIDQDYRGIVLKPERGDVYCLLWVDKHDDAYEWARRRRAAIHPEAGNIQIYESSQVGETVASSQAEGSTGLFASLRDRELLRLGVPDEAIVSVRAVDSLEALDALQGKLPVDAYEYLYLFAAGESYETLVADRELPPKVDVTDFAAALELDATKRQFVVISDDADLQALLSAPLATWRVFLHPSQRRLVERDWNGPVRVLGGAGTGKTVAAMHRAVWLARHRFASREGKPILFATFTRTLADDIRAQLRALASPGELARIEVVNVDQWATGILRRYGYAYRPLFDERDRRRAWESALTRKPESPDLSDAFFRTEFERVVLAKGCETLEDYLKVSRVGRGVQLSRAQRQAIWPVFAEYRSQLTAHKLREPEDAYRDALTKLQSDAVNLGVHTVVIDETQDLSAAALQLLRAAVPAGPNDLFLVGDAHQRIYRHKVSLSAVGIDIRGRGRRLRINYRTTDEIRRWATAQLEGCSIDDLDGQSDSLRGYKSLTHGPSPDVRTFASRADERAAILACIGELRTNGVADSGICLVTRTNPEADEYAAWLTSTGASVHHLSGETADDQEASGIRVATMHRVKGLEFDAMIIAGYRGPENLAKQFADEGDAGSIADSVTAERSLLHVAATRAKRFLTVCELRS